MPSIKYALYRSAIFICLFVCITNKCFSTALIDSIPYDAKLIKGHLANGLTYYIRPNAVPEHRLELRLVVKAGSILEDDDQQGLAHFIEHMNFNGTKNFPGNTLVSYFESIGMKFGADINANTGYDRTLYELSVPTTKPGDVDKAFLVLEDWAHNALLTDNDIDREKGVILEEYRLKRNATLRMNNQYYPELICHTKYADREPIGKDSIIANVSHEALRRFYHDWYRPDLMAVIVIGDIDTAEAKQLITAHFSGLSNPPAERAHFFSPMPERTHQSVMIVTDNEASTSTWDLYYPFKKYVNEPTVGCYRDMLKQELLFELLNVRLRNLYQSGVQGASISFSPLHECRSLHISTTFPDGDPNNSIKAILYTIMQPGSYGFLPPEIERAKKELLSNAEKAYNEREKTPSSWYIAEYVRSFMDNEVIEGPENEYHLTATLLPGISNGELESLLHKLTANENIFSFITAPAGSKSHLPDSADFQNTVNVGMHLQTYAMKEKVPNETLLNNEPRNRKIAGQETEPGLGAITYTLTNGIKVTVKSTNYKNDEILIDGIKNGGVCNYEQKDRANCIFAGMIVPLMGYGNYSPNELNTQLAGKNVAVATTIGYTTDEVNGHCGKRDLETMFQLMYLELTQYNKNRAVYKNWRNVYEKHIGDTYPNPEAFLIDTFKTVLFNNDPSVEDMAGASDVKKLHILDALKIYDNEFGVADGYHFFIDGNVDTAILLPLITRYLGSLPVSGSEVACYDNGARPITGNNKFTIHKGLAKQSYILIKYYGDSLQYSEEVERNMNALTDILNIKAIQHFREQMADIYTGGFTGEIITKPYSHYEITLSLPCGAEHVDELLAATDTEIKAIKEQGPTDEDVEKIKAQLKEEYKVNIQSNAYWLRGMKRILFSGHSADNFLNYPAFINKITKADIQATANLLFNGKNQLTGILLPE